MAAISVPFRFNEFGQVDASITESKFWKDQVLLTLMTRFGERIMRPDFGSNIGDTVFESLSVAGDSALSTVSSTFNLLLPKLSLTETTVDFNETTGFLEITVMYKLPSGNSDTITVNTAIFNRSGDLLEEIPRG